MTTWPSWPRPARRWLPTTSMATDSTLRVRESCGILSVVRATYTPPTLVVYGDVLTLTRSAEGGKNDKGSGSKTRTG